MKNRCEDSPSLYPAYTTKGVFFELLLRSGVGGCPNFYMRFFAAGYQKSEVRGMRSEV
jgi:hypothetical protein